MISDWGIQVIYTLRLDFNRAVWSFFWNGESVLLYSNSLWIISKFLLTHLFHFFVSVSVVRHPCPNITVDSGDTIPCVCFPSIIYEGIIFPIEITTMSLVDVYTIMLMLTVADVHVQRQKRRHRWWWIRNSALNRLTYCTYHYVKELELSNGEF